MRTLLGTEIDANIKGVLYICRFSHMFLTLKVTREILFENQADALEAYANIPNPESQVAFEKPTSTLEEELEKLHKNMIDPYYLKGLAASL